jgi:hypothetical protein
MSMAVLALTFTLAAALSFAAHLMRCNRRLHARLRELSSEQRAAQSIRGRDAFTQDLELEIGRVARTGRPASLLLMSLGSDPTSEPAVRARTDCLAALSASSVRVIDLCYRIGGDEIALILPETRAEGALVAAARIQAKLLSIGAGGLTAGVAELGPGMDRQLFFRQAYCALLWAGREGRPELLAYSPELEGGRPHTESGDTPATQTS